MASAWPEEETFVCSVCLDDMTDPATLPCGHSYCLRCIESHWDRGDTEGLYSCPQCRRVFSPRPSVARSTVLAEAMEKLRATGVQRDSFPPRSSAPPSFPIYLDVLPHNGETAAGGPQRLGSLYPQLPTVEARLCPRHRRPLDLFCHDDKECVCEECGRHGHRGHRVLRPQDERRERQVELLQMQADVRKKIQETEKELQDFPRAASDYKASVQALQKESVDLFLEIAKSTELLGTDVRELLCAHEASLGSRAEGHIHRLEQEVAQLRWKSHEMDKLAEMQDNVCFLKNFLTMEPLGNREREESGLGQEVQVAAGIRSALTELQDSIQDLCKDSLAKMFRVVNPVPVALTDGGEAAAGPVGRGDGVNVTAQNTASPTPPPPPLPSRPQACAPTPPPLPPPRPQASPLTAADGVVCQSREELLTHHFEPTMDPNTAFRHILLTEGGRRATLRAENLNPVDHPERFTFWRQVLGKEPLAKCPYYWEVEWTGQKITIGVAYKEMERKGSDDLSRLGHNASSWSLYWSGTGFSYWHRAQETLLGSPKARRIGVYVDQYSGSLAFYRISGGQAHLIHWQQTHFTGALYPGFRFWSGVGSTVAVCQLG